MTETDFPTGDHAVCPRCGRAAKGAFCAKCGLDLSAQGDLPTADAYSARLHAEQRPAPQERVAHPRPVPAETGVPPAPAMLQPASAAGSHSGRQRRLIAGIAAGLLLAGGTVAVVLAGGPGDAGEPAVATPEAAPQGTPGAAAPPPETAPPPSTPTAAPASPSADAELRFNTGRDPGEETVAAVCAVVEAALKCWTPNDGFTLILRKAGPSFRDPVQEQRNRGREPDYPELGAGERWNGAGFRCVSRETGLTCRNPEGRGWKLPRYRGLPTEF